MLTAIIILNYNDSETTEKLVNKIISYKKIDKIIIVDNKSTDKSYEKLKKYESKKIDVIQTLENKGYASGNNYGAFFAIKKYNPRYIIIANPDIEFEEEIITKIIDKLESSDCYALGTARMYKENNFWKLPTFKDNIMSMFLGISKIKRILKNKKNRKIKNDEIEIEVAAGSFFIIKSKVFKEINGFDEETFLYCEENILAEKLKKAGYKSLLLNNCVYFHYHSVSINRVYKSRMQPFKIYCDSLRIYNRHLDINKFQKIIFELFFNIAYFERKCYDIFLKNKYLKSKGIDK